MPEALISSIRSLINVSEGEGDVICRLFKRRELKKGEFFLHDGQVCKHAGFIEKGLVRYYINADGEEKTYDFGKEYNFVCNYESFLTQTPSTKIIQALEDCALWQISHADLQVFYRSVSGGERFGRVVIEQVFVQLLQALTSLYTDSPEDRYQKLMSEHPTCCNGCRNITSPPMSVSSRNPSAVSVKEFFPKNDLLTQVHECRGGVKEICVII
ncbi:Crp/Fnr family transcriptional regulator [Mucilaginibacter pedocola]|uniref:Crp/Fnr family transcriptional regulator n=1 Tax=Mucilaginibacter pedocola TaxID=1792845 RepID=UPI001EE40034|nr:cyclic nucleotide-binding domain-containing protein [Mucilaginibacter pedocola]